MPAAATTASRPAAARSPHGRKAIFYTEELGIAAGAAVRGGLTGTLSDRLRQVVWAGRGPGENYRDRNSGSPLGRWESTAGGFPHACAHPQENGNRTGLESLTLRSPRPRSRSTSLIAGLAVTRRVSCGCSRGRRCPWLIEGAAS
jgi:hypothetical protein